ncbi:MAG TPA: response regulator [Pyrinomonadaceae bacterium]|jgi:CheY-like chemotaxis protein|nr:response regulator [Pyrinomonadaceae bacterium]
MGKGKRRRPLILDVNDDPSLQMLFCDMLRRMGYDVVAASDGRDGVEKALREKPDLILMNLMMPVMDGREATRLLRENPLTREVPIILNTACSDPETLDDAMSAGFTDYFTLPTGPRVIIEMVERYCPSRER